MTQNSGRPNRGAPPGTPRWVKILGFIFIALIALVIVLHLTGNSLGGPGSHAPLLEFGIPMP